MKWNKFFKKVRFVKLVYATVPILVVIVFGSVLLQSSEANSQPGVQAAPCTLATLTGSYGTTVSFVAEDGVGAAIGRWAFDGAGNVSGSFYINGVPGRGRGTFKGTYKVQPNCTGSLSVDFGRFYVVIVNGGNEFFTVRTDGRDGSIITGKKQ